MDFQAKTHAVAVKILQALALSIGRDVTEFAEVCLSRVLHPQYALLCLRAIKAVTPLQDIGTLQKVLWDAFFLPALAGIDIAIVCQR